jgi:AcrR family transcriptional regulator
MAASHASNGAPARDRILESAYELFSHHGVRAIGIDAIIKHSGVARMTLYRNFTSKNELVLEFLRTREQRWTVGWLQEEVRRYTGGARARLLGIFDLFDEWFRQDDFEGCSFINVMLETTDAKSPLHQASVAHLAEIRSFLRSLAVEAGVADPDDFSCKWHLLMKGSIVAATEGDREAARRAQAIGRLLLEGEHR